MKKIISIIMSAVLVLSTLSLVSFAQEPTVIGEEENIIYYSDGSYAVFTIEEIASMARATSKTYGKTVTLYDGDGVKIGTLTVYGTFSINTGTSVSCTSARYSTSITSEDNWDFYDTDASYSNHTSYATATATSMLKKKFLGITINNKKISVTVRCNSDGTVS